jgi:hypothetical protein
MNKKTLKNRLRVIIDVIDNNSLDTGRHVMDITGLKKRLIDLLIDVDRK